MSASFRRRLGTFRDWPASSCQLPETLAASGFAYEGRGDRVTCGTCRVRLYDWVQCDPLEQHGKFSKHKCELYLRIKGQQNGLRGNNSGNLDADGSADCQESQGFTNTQRGYSKSKISSQTAGVTRQPVVNQKKVQSQDLLSFSRECVDIEPPPVSQRIAADGATAGSSQETKNSAQRWVPGLDQAFLDREELLVLQRHGVDRKRILTAVRRRLDAGLDILSDPDGMRRELLS